MQLEGNQRSADVHRDASEASASGAFPHAVSHVQVDIILIGPMAIRDSISLTLLLNQLRRKDARSI